MSIAYEVRSDTYFDSVTLMLVGSEIEKIDGVEEAVIGMATDYNLDSLRRLDMFQPEFEEASTNDLILCVKATSDEIASSALAETDKKLQEQESSSGGTTDYEPPTQEGAAEMMPDANVVLISIPGEYAADEAHEALDNDRHVMLFSDNVSLEEELELKKKAVDKGLLMMGPDCGTSIINNVPLAFSNVVRSGNIGLVAASGTGLQETSSIIHQLGFGITQGIGVGGRDLSAEIEGRMTLLAAKALARDDATDLITLISKPPAKSILDDLYSELKAIDKPVVIYFIGADPEVIEAEGFTAANNLEEAAIKTCQLAGDAEIDPLLTDDEITARAADVELDGKYLRGLYSGGTLCDEAQRLLLDRLEEIYSNTPVEGSHELEDLYESQKHTVIDLGEDEFTEGRAHPMIDPTLRQERIVQELTDPETAIVLLDVVLGYGSNPDMAGALVEAIEEGRQKADHQPVVAASLCGTEDDPQGYTEQKETLESAGVHVFPSNVSMVKFAEQCFKKD